MQEKGQKLLADYGVKNESNSKWHDECINRLFFALFHATSQKNGQKNLWKSGGTTHRALSASCCFTAATTLLSVGALWVFSCSRVHCTYADTSQGGICTSRCFTWTKPSHYYIAACILSSQAKEGKRPQVSRAFTQFLARFQHHYPHRIWALRWALM